MRTVDEYLEEENYLINKLSDPLLREGEKHLTIKKLKLIQKEMRELDTSAVPEHSLPQL